MNLLELQKDMRRAYLGGGAGVLVWLTAGILAYYVTKQTSILVFFLGGMLIHPLGLLVAKLFNRGGKHEKDNPLALLALESTAILFVGLFIAYVILQVRPDWFFPVMLMMIGVRYLVFRSIYGMKVFWILGLVLILSGTACLVSNQPFPVPAVAGGVIEIVFSAFIIQSERKSQY